MANQSSARACSIGGLVLSWCSAVVFLLIAPLALADTAARNTDVLAGIESARRHHPYVVVIDPGHGGRDHGTTAAGLAHEKDVVLGIARAMTAHLAELEGVEVVLTRDRDVFVPLSTRLSLARSTRADLFMSIHVNSAPSRKAHGAEVYFLSPDGATDATAKASEDRENAALLVAGAGAERADDDLLSILVDLQSTAALRSSSVLAEIALDKLEAHGIGTGRAVKQANFVVLRTLSMPSVLVEAGFMSHREEARRLASPEWQGRIGWALSDAVVEYFRRMGDRGPVGSLGSPMVHRVRSGDTLWSLARERGVTIDRLRDANALRDDRLRVGQILLLP